MRAWSRVLLAVALLLGCAGAAGLRIDPARDIGIARVAPGGVGCLTLPRHGLPSGTRILLIALPAATSDGRTRLMEAEILEAAADDTRCEDEAGGSDESRYRLQLTDSAAYGPFFALHGPRDALVMTPATASIVSDSGDPAIFRVCTSMEGLHMTLWEGAPLSGRRLFHRYVPLGMDVEPSCAEADWSGTAAGD